eukprot:2497905-Rhodomonas_salina.1
MCCPVLTYGIVCPTSTSTSASGTAGDVGVGILLRIPGYHATRWFGTDLGRAGTVGWSSCCVGERARDSSDEGWGGVCGKLWGGSWMRHRQYYLRFHYGAMLCPLGCSAIFHYRDPPV